VWEFLGNVLEEGGVVAALFFLLTIGFGFVVRALWSKNQELHREIAQLIDGSKTMAEAHAIQLREMSKEQMEQLKALAAQHAADRKQHADEYARQLLAQAAKINELQERRVEETRTVTEKVIRYIGHIDQFANKLEATIDVLLRASGERR